MLDVTLFPAKLQKYRNSKGLTQEQFAEIIGYSTNHYSRVETGFDPPSFHFLMQCCFALHVPVSCFYSDAEPLSQRNPDLYNKLITLDEETLRKISAVLGTLTEI